MFIPHDYFKDDSMGERILPRKTNLKVLEMHPLTDYGTRRCELLQGRRAIICKIINEYIIPLLQY